MIVAFIPAKGGSTRLPNKNMALVNGRPMIDYAIEHAKASTHVQAIYVTTDAEDIAAHARSRGVNVIMRDTSLGGDTPLLDVYRHALRQINDPSIKMIVGVQPDHPDRTVSLDEAIAAFRSAGPDCELLYSTEADGKKNGAQCVISRTFLESGKNPAVDVVNKIGIVDDCTNVHYPDDLKRAEERLIARVCQ